MISRKGRLVTAAMVAGVLALSACSATTNEPSGDVPQVLAVAGNFPVVSLDPYGQYSADAATAFVGKQIYDTLTVTDGKGGYVPHLATKWEPTDDGRVWTFTLRDAKFSDGSDFTSADVKASIDAIIAGGGPFAKSWEPVTVETPDARTVVFKLDTTGSAVMTIIPQLRIGPASGISNPDFFTKPVGLGPFMVSSFTSEQEVVLERNPNYWGEPATLEEVTIKTISDISARVTALLNNEVQAAWGIPDDQFGQLEDNDSLETTVAPSYSQFTMWMNSKQPALAKLEVRQAIWKSIDWEAIQKALYPYSATPAKAPVSQAVAGAGSFDPYTYDPDEAKQMLSDAGFPNGLTVRLQYSSAKDFGQLAAAMKSDLAKVGVTVEIDAKEQAVWLEDLLALNWDINLQTTGPATGDPTADLSRLYKCSANRTGFCSDELDQLIAAGDAAVDPAERAAQFLKVQKLIWENAIGMFPMDVATTYAWSTTLEGFTPDPNFAPNLATVKVIAAP
jgi:peptide/nickel transport system substrate-binding protein